jgi:hypothetical protein
VNRLVAAFADGGAGFQTILTLEERNLWLLEHDVNLQAEGLASAGSTWAATDWSIFGLSLAR